MKKHVALWDQQNVCSDWRVGSCVVWEAGLGGAEDEVKELICHFMKGRGQYGKKLGFILWKIDTLFL